MIRYSLTLQWLAVAFLTLAPAHATVREFVKEAKGIAGRALSPQTGPTVAGDARGCLDSVLFGVRIAASGFVPGRLSEAEMRFQKMRLARSPRRDLKPLPVVQHFLRRHKVYVSLTTSPTRVSQIRHVLETLDLENVEEVLIALPERFGRDGTPYEIPEELARMPKVRILRPSKDVGPATKLLPAVRYALAKDAEPIVITVDDDFGYPAGAINELIYASTAYPGAAIGSAGSGFGRWGLQGRASELKPLMRDERTGLDSSSVDVVEGFGAIAYPAWRVDADQIEAWAGRCKDCLLSDDLVISMSLRTSGVPRRRIRGPHFNKGMLQPFAYGFKADALHKGAGMDPTGEDPNTVKYRKTFDVLRDEIKP